MPVINNCGTLFALRNVNVVEKRKLLDQADQQRCLDTTSTARRARQKILTVQPLRRITVQALRSAHIDRCVVKKNTRPVLRIGVDVNAVKERAIRRSHRNYRVECDQTRCESRPLRCRNARDSKILITVVHPRVIQVLLDCLSACCETVSPREPPPK